MKSVKLQQRTRVGSRNQHSSGLPRSTSLVPLLPDCTPSAPQLGLLSGSRTDGYSSSEANLPLRQNELQTAVIHPSSTAGHHSSAATSSGDMNQVISPSEHRCGKVNAADGSVPQKSRNQHDSNRANSANFKQAPPRSCVPIEQEDPLSRQIKDVHNDTRKSARIIKDSKARLVELQKKTHLTEADVKELSERHELLLREMDRFERMTKSLQKLVGAEVHQLKKSNAQCVDYIPGSIYEPLMYQEMKMNHPTVLLAGSRPPDLVEPITARSKSEIDLTRKLNESYDMQEKLVADNADLEVKRYILYKELMTKDQNLETSRAQVKRLQGELKLMNKENAMLSERLSKNNPEGDATSLDQECNEQKYIENYIQQEHSVDPATVKELLLTLESYKSSTAEFESQLEELETEVKKIRDEINVKDDIKAAAIKMSKEGAGGPSYKGGGGTNTCFSQPLAVLRAELLKKKEELEKERCLRREAQNKLRDLEMKFEGLATHTNMMLGTKEQAFKQEVNVRALKQCYREARDEIEELRILLKE